VLSGGSLGNFALYEVCRDHIVFLYLLLMEQGVKKAYGKQR
jgi:hypothetical protein